MKLKTNLHFHSSEDPLDLFIKYDIYQGIDQAKKEGFKVLGLTCHNKFVYQTEFGDYAKKRGLLLIPGIEISINRGHILILNCDREAENIKTFADLREYKKKNPHIFIIAPHPCYFFFSLNKDLIKNINIFDAIEYSWFSFLFFDKNKKAQRIAQKFKKPFIANSDTHNLKYLKKTYSVIHSKSLNVEAIFDAIKKNNFKNVTKKITFWESFSYLLWYFYSQTKVFHFKIIEFLFKLKKIEFSLFARVRTNFKIFLIFIFLNIKH